MDSPCHWLGGAGRRHRMWLASPDSLKMTRIQSATERLSLEGRHLKSLRPRGHVDYIIITNHHISYHEHSYFYTWSDVPFVSPQKFILSENIVNYINLTIVASIGTPNWKLSMFHFGQARSSREVQCQSFTLVQFGRHKEGTVKISLRSSLVKQRQNIVKIFTWVQLGQ